MHEHASRVTRRVALRLKQLIALSSHHATNTWAGRKKKGVKSATSKSTLALPSVSSLPAHIFRVTSLSLTAPDDQLQPLLMLYYHLGMNNTDIATSVMDHFDPSRYGIRYDPRHIISGQHNTLTLSVAFTQFVADVKNGA